MERIRLEEGKTTKKACSTNNQARIFQPKYLFVLFLIFLILGTGYNIKIYDTHQRETKTTLLKTSKSISYTLNEFRDGRKTNQDFAALFFNKNNFQPLWTKGFQENHYAKSLENLLENQHQFGLIKNTQLIQDINRLKEDMQASKSLDQLSKFRADYELLLTDAAIRLLVQLDKGIIYADTISDETKIISYIDYLFKSIHAKNFEESFLSVQPDNKIYHQLIKGLKFYLKNASLSTKTNEIDITNFEASKNTATAIFRELGYISEKESLDSMKLIETLKTFQQFHGINPSGTFCKKTIQAMEMSSYERYQKIIINIERAKTDEIEGSTYIYVNIPAFSLKLFQDGKKQLQHQVMVGKPKSPTPVLSSKIEYLVANPKWFVPKSISSSEILYHIKKDSSYLAKRNFILLDNEYKKVDHSEINWQEINYRNFDYKLYQEPGRGNALGKVKFMFPNKYSVYVHDTQSKSLFNNDYRAYSHGCIRLQNPLDFADHLLTHVDSKNLYKTIKPIVKSKKTKEIRFTSPIDIHIRYFTCEADENNLLYFYQDVYCNDEALKKQIFKI